MAPDWLGEPTELGSHEGVSAVAVDPQGRWMVTGGQDDWVRLWHLDRPGEPTELGSHDSTVAAVAVDPQGAWVVTGRCGCGTPIGAVSHSWGSTRT